MPTYEELLEIIAEQNKIIEKLTAELASAKAVPLETESLCS